MSDSKKGNREQIQHIAGPLRRLAVPIESIVFDPANARLHDERNIEAIKSSLSRFGQRKPIVVRKKGRIVEAGNGTVEAARSLGWSHVAAVVIDDNAHDAAAFALADNRSSELADWDDDVLSLTLASLYDDGVNLDGLGWTTEEIAALTDADPLDGADPEGIAMGNPPAPLRCIVIPLGADDDAEKTRLRIASLNLEAWDMNLIDSSPSTAMARQGPSKPIGRLIASIDQTKHKSVLDYGCGRGADVRAMLRAGLDATGFDPYWNPTRPKGRFDIVSCIYVLNVIIRPLDRLGLLEAIDTHSDGGLFIAVRSAKEVAAEAARAGWSSIGDGFLTGSGTFQCGYTVESLGAMLAEFGPFAIREHSGTIYAEVGI